MDRRVRPSRALEVCGLGLISDAAAAGSLRAQGFQTALGQGEGGAGGQRPRAWHPEPPGLRGGQPQQEFGRRVSALLLARRAAALPRGGVRWAAGAERSEGGELAQAGCAGCSGSPQLAGATCTGPPGRGGGPRAWRSGRGRALAACALPGRFPDTPLTAAALSERGQLGPCFSAFPPPLAFFEL